MHEAVIPFIRKTKQGPLKTAFYLTAGKTVPLYICRESYAKAVLCCLTSVEWNSMLILCTCVQKHLSQVRRWRMSFLLAVP